jgi:hypothetical protein
MRGNVLPLFVYALCVSGCYQTIPADVLVDGGTDAGVDGGDDAGKDADAGPDPDAGAAPDAAVAVMGCSDLCASVLDWTSQELNCIGRAVRLAGYAPGATPECRVMRNPAECEACAEGAGLTDVVCIGAAFICLP